MIRNIKMVLLAPLVFAAGVSCVATNDSAPVPRLDCTFKPSEEDIPSPSIGERRETKLGEGFELISDFTLDGKLARQLIYHDGILDGSTLSWHPNGQLASVGAFNEGTRQGLWQYWDSKGVLTKQELYIHGLLKWSSADK